METIHQLQMQQIEHQHQVDWIRFAFLCTGSLFAFGLFAWAMWRMAVAMEDIEESWGE